MSLLERQNAISPQRGMPTNDLGQSSKVKSITGEAVQLYYSNSGVRTIDAGQAAGVAVEGKLLYDNIKNANGSMCGTKSDTSLSFTAGALTTEVDITPAILEALDSLSFASRITALTSGLANGEYVVDYVNGVIYGKKASTATTLAGTAYKILSNVGDVTLEASDIEIGAVELKDGTTDARAPISATEGLLVNLGTNNDVTIETPTILVGGVKVVTTAGTAVPLASTTTIKEVTIVANPANTGDIYVGDSGVSSATGVILEAGDSITIEIADPSDVYLDSSVNGEGVRFLTLV